MANVTAVLFCLATILIASQTSAFLNDDKCKLDSDCPGGCCAMKRDGNVCQKFGVEGAICDLEGQGLAKDACACAAGLKCDHIDLTELGVDALVNTIFDNHHYGQCGAPTNALG